MDQEQQAAFSNLTFFRHYDINLRWSITQLFFVIHSAILSLVVTQFRRGSLEYAAACIAGFCLGWLWRRMTIRITRWIEHWTQRMRVLESSNRAANRVFGSELMTMRGATRTIRILNPLIGGFMALWVILLIVSLNPR
ncbi:MAG: hypothetical protein Q8R39_02915 [bacterium]|nr:hypothetical protein [bacterium]MDZ4284506.1 hypothetical protein [Patescibacteria group bacterium]